MNAAAGTRMRMWNKARFADCILDVPRRELRHRDEIRFLEPRVMALLVYLIEHRHQVLSRDSILRAISDDLPRSDSALSRTVMKLRRSLGDDEDEHPVIKTLQRVGYCFVAEVTFDEPAGAAAGPALPPALPRGHDRLAVLPFYNATGERDLAWVEFGLVSLLTNALRQNPRWNLVPLQDVMQVAGARTGTALPAQCLPRIAEELGTETVIWGSLGGKRGNYLLEFDLTAPHGLALSGAVAGSDPTRLAGDMARCIDRWLHGGRETLPRTIDLRDDFLNEAFGMALQRSRENRFREAEHLLDLLEGHAREASILLERAHVAVMLGRPDAGDRLEALERAARAGADAYLKAHASALQGTLLEQQGPLGQAAESFRQASEAAYAVGMEDLELEWALDCAHCLGGIFAPEAGPLLSRVFPRVARLGNRVLLSKAHWVAGKLAGFADAWVAAILHHRAAVSMLTSMEGTVRFAPSSILGWSRAQLGELHEATESALAAVRDGRKSGRKPENGLSAGAAAHLCLANRRIGDLIDLQHAVIADTDQSLAMRVTREVHCQAPLMYLAGRHDEAAELAASAALRSEGNPVLVGRCLVARLTALLRAQRYADVQALCVAVGRMDPARRDPRISPWIERAMAARECHGEGDRASAIARLERVATTGSMSESHAISTLELCWMLLEDGHTARARRLVAYLPDWLAQSPSGMLVDARLRDACGDPAGALQIQDAFLAAHPQTATPFHARLRAFYEAHARDAQDVAIASLDTPLDLAWDVAPALRARIEVVLGPARRESAVPALQEADRAAAGVAALA